MELKPQQTPSNGNLIALPMLIKPPFAGGKQPPQASETEQVVLGAIMLEKDAITKVIDLLKPEYFYRPAHKAIYEACINLYMDSQPVDILTVPQQLAKNGTLQNAGGYPYVSGLTTYVVSSANIEFHARIIVEKHLHRSLISTCGEISEKAYDETNDVFELLDNAENQLYKLNSQNQKEEAVPISTLLSASIKTLEERQKNKGSATGITTGFYELDKMTAGWQNSDLIIVAARPSMGKTAFVLSQARNAAILGNKAVAIFSLEMTAAQLTERLISSEAEIDASRMRVGDIEAHEWKAINKAMTEIDKAKIFINDTAGLSINDLRSQCRRLKSQNDVGLIIIDYLQLMTGETSGNKNGNREQEIASISRGLKRLAKELEVPVIALSQLSRSVETRGGNKRPMLSDIRESGAIEQDADVVAFLYRPEYYGVMTDENGQGTAGVAEVIIGKHRNGAVGTVKLQFMSRFAKFADLDAQYKPAYKSNSTSIIVPNQSMQKYSEVDEYVPPF
jgi:replicative DNA helicase